MNKISVTEKTGCEDIVIETNDFFVTSIRFTTQDIAQKASAQKHISTINEELRANTSKQFKEYFAGKLKVFSVPIELCGTEFQVRVWKEVMRVPYGQTASYAQIAEKIGRPTAVRAVASAIAKNKLALVLPCHRIIRSDGQMGGYAWGLDLKKRLLSLETNS